MNRISVIIPLYNKENYIKRAINSVLAQTIQDWELIVVDDGSSDNGGRVVKEFADPRIKYIWQENAGVSAARNRGIRESGSDVVAFLDADDEWCSDHLATIINLRDNYPEAKIYSTAFLMKDPDNHETRSHNLFLVNEGESKQFYLRDYLMVALQDGFPLHTICTAFHKSVFPEVGYFRVGENFGEDTDMFLRVLLKYPLAYCNRITAVYHLFIDNSLCAIQKHNLKNATLETVKSELPIQRIKDCRIAGLLEEYMLSMTITYAKSLAEGGSKIKAAEVLSEIRTTRKNLWRKSKLYLFIFLPGKTKWIWERLCGGID